MTTGDAQYYQRTVLKECVVSDFLGESRNLRVFLPPGYNELLSYPVLYCQDGEDFFNFGRAATTATRLILDENMSPFLIVGVDVDKKVRTEEYAPDGSRFQAYCGFFAEELIPWVEQRFAARPSRDERLLAGDSLGGTVSLHLALDYPELFNQVIALSGAFLPSSSARVARETDLSWLKLYQLIGLDEDEVKTDRGRFDFLSLNREMKVLLEARGTQLVYEEKPGKHVWGLWQAALPEALKKFWEI
ncbi:alpha/beta hydrolase [Paenibacillus sp. y28]|uniref:alpha/beta hydrolase n=1 Tax=Paenibacillus sp. y28 TaxID=3129110 RepID=UPI00301B28DA